MSRISLTSTAELCDQIRAVLAAPDSATPTSLAALARSYSNHATEVNERLRRAVEWLRRGLWAEAVQYVQQPPDALECATRLELGFDKPRWIELAASAGASELVLVNADLAAEISAACATAEKHKVPLAVYRRACLSFAPTTERLAALDALIAADAGNNVWKEQRKSLEPLRLQQMLEQARVASQARDEAVLRSLRAEADASVWQVKPPAKFVAALQSELDKARREVLRAQVLHTADALHKAHAAQDEPLARSLMTHWRELLATGLYLPSGSEGDAAMEVEAWLAARTNAAEEAQEAEQAAVAMQSGLDDNVAFDELERRHARLVRTGRDVPRVIQTRFREREREHAIAKRRKHVMILSAGFAAILLLGAGVWYVVDSRARDKERIEWSTRLASALESNDIERLRALSADLTSSAPRAARHPEIIALSSQVAERLDAAKLADERFEQIASVFRVADDASIDDARLSEAQSLARTQAQRQEIAAFRARFDALRQRTQELVDAPFREQHERLALEYRALPTVSPTREDEDALLGRLNKICEDFESLLKTPGVSDAPKQAATTLLLSIYEQRNALQEKHARSDRAYADLDRLPVDLRTGSELAKRYRKFIDDHPSAEPAAKLSSSLKHERAWQVIDLWSTSADTWNGKIQVTTAEQAQTRLRDVEPFLDELEEGELAAHVRFVRGYWTKSAEQLSEPSKPAGYALLESNLQLPWLTQMREVKDRAGKVFYSIAGELDGATPDGYSQLSNIINDIRDYQPGAPVRSKSAPVQVDGRQLQDSPHTKTVTGMLALFAQKPLPDWELLPLQLAAKVEQDKDSNEIIKLRLLNLCFSEHVANGWPVSDNVVAFADQFAKDDSPAKQAIDANWPRADDRGVQAHRSVAADLIKRAPSAAQELADAKQRFAEANRRFANPLRFAAVVWPDDDGEITLRGVFGDGDFFSASMASDGKVVIRKLGTIRAGSPTWTGDSLPDLGTPIFMRKP